MIRRRVVSSEFTPGERDRSLQRKDLFPIQPPPSPDHPCLRNRPRCNSARTKVGASASSPRKNGQAIFDEHLFVLFLFQLAISFGKKREDFVQRTREREVCREIMEGENMRIRDCEGKKRSGELSRV